MRDEKNQAKLDRYDMAEKAGFPLAHFLEDAMKYVLKDEYDLALQEIIGNKQKYERQENHPNSESIENLDLSTLLHIFDNCITNYKDNPSNVKQTDWRNNFIGVLKDEQTRSKTFNQYKTLIANARNVRNAFAHSSAKDQTEILDYTGDLHKLRGLFKELKKVVETQHVVFREETKAEVVDYYENIEELLKKDYKPEQPQPPPPPEPVEPTPIIIQIPSPPPPEPVEPTPIIIQIPSEVLTPAAPARGSFKWRYLLSALPVVALVLYFVFRDPALPVPVHKPQNVVYVLVQQTPPPAAIDSLYNYIVTRKHFATGPVTIRAVTEKGLYKGEVRADSLGELSRVELQEFLVGISGLSTPRRASDLYTTVFSEMKIALKNNDNVLLASLGSAGADFDNQFISDYSAERWVHTPIGFRATWKKLHEHSLFEQPLYIYPHKQSWLDSSISLSFTDEGFPAKVIEVGSW